MTTTQPKRKRGSSQNHPLEWLTGKARFWAAVAAQGAGLVLLIILGILVFPNHQDNIDRGLTVIHRAIGVYLVSFVAILFIPPIIAACKRSKTVLEHDFVDWAIWAFVWVDINLLLTLVCQEKGLCRSMFLPVFLLIPVAYVSVERIEKKSHALVVLAMIIVYMVISFYMSDRNRVNLTYLIPLYVLTLGAFLLMGTDRIRARYRFSAIGAILLACMVIPLYCRDRNLWHSLSMWTTDFHHDAHRGFDQALFVASLISVLTPFGQTLIILFQERKILSEQADANATAKT
jgi:MFS family permease